MWKEHPAQRGQIKLFGKMIETPRWTSFLNSYSGITQEKKEIPLSIEPLITLLRKQCEEFDKKQMNQDLHLNQCLINWYADGDDYIGKHSGDEKRTR